MTQQLTLKFYKWTLLPLELNLFIVILIKVIKMIIALQVTVI
jgi:hypothetical protein